MMTLFISDLHLSAADPETDARFRAFVRGPARKCTQLYILGDLFHQWLGDSQLAGDEYALGIARDIRSLSASGCVVKMIVGNRDFMLGETFAKAAGVQVLEGPCVEIIGRTPVLLLHGDELCTDDVAYQRARRVLRHPLFKPGVSLLPFSARAAIARSLKRRSNDHKSRQPMAIMDVAESAVLAAFSRFETRIMIHGHTHRPGTHTHTVNGKTCTRHVLDDWQFGSGYSAFRDDEIAHYDWPI